MTYSLPVDELDGLVERVDVDDAEDRAEYLLLVGVHVGRHVGDHSGPHKVSVRILLHLMEEITICISFVRFTSSTIYIHIRSASNRWTNLHLHWI